MIKQEINQLTEQLNRWNIAYYEEDRELVSDAEYDKAMRRLEELEREYPQYARNDSPTQRVGGKAVDRFPQVEPVSYTHLAVYKRQRKNFGTRVLSESHAGFDR